MKRRPFFGRRLFCYHESRLFFGFVCFLPENLEQFFVIVHESRFITIFLTLLRLRVSNFIILSVLVKAEEGALQVDIICIWRGQHCTSALVLASFARRLRFISLNSSLRRTRVLFIRAQCSGIA